MGLQWMILTYVVAAEAALAFLLTIPAPKLLKNRFVSLVSLILQPALFIVPFAGFQLLDIYWKNEHRLACTSDICTASERDRYEKSMYKAQRNVILCASACLLYCNLQILGAGVYFASVNCARTFRTWRKWRRGTRTSRFSDIGPSLAVETTELVFFHHK
ncbi:uncharacterized protein LOC103950546 isoform X1 [Pyrus x bretschneideri]|uniref:uncharacterized protein LOC103950546 isoform X1 n=1 Tax=Pyrus x bretschneideri TaxID=225117 RepID=UPI00202EE8ED|nr:uncharacterized protein LOC103950546 isoform X1 [Pyrus x bretschneideri]